MLNAIDLMLEKILCSGTSSGNAELNPNFLVLFVLKNANERLIKLDTFNDSIRTKSGC